MDTSGQSLSLPVAQAIEKFKTVFLQRVQALETVGKKDVASSLLEATLRTTLDPSPGKRDIELVQKHAGVLDTRSAINILAIRSKLQQLQRQGYDVPSSIEEISKRVDQVDLSVVGLPTRKRKRDPNSDSEANNELPKRPKSTPTERYLDNYKKRKAELDENEPETSPLAKRLRFTNYRDPILYVPDPIAFQFEVCILRFNRFRF